jgi:hypothetical protein
MTVRIRFHLDENVDSAVADGLRRRGVDVTMPNDVGLIGASDEAHLAFAFSQQRVIFTHDDDFLSLAAGGSEHWGLAFCHAEARSIGQILAGLLLIVDCLAPEEMRNHIEFL